MMGSHRRILVVEDDAETAGQLKEQLATSGYEVDWAGTGNEALNRGADSDYAVITIDRMLPDIDGLTVMRQLRDDGVAAPSSRNCRITVRPSISGNMRSIVITA